MSQSYRRRQALAIARSRGMPPAFRLLAALMLAFAGLRALLPLH